MHIVEISARNFRTLESLSVGFSPGYVAISGKNNAGKSNLIKIIQHFFGADDRELYFSHADEAIRFSRDLTQWSGEREIFLSLAISLNKSDDAGLYSFVNRFSSVRLESDEVVLRLEQTLKSDEKTTRCFVERLEFDPQASREILRKIANSANYFLHNSTRQDRRYFYMDEGITEIFDIHIPEEQLKTIRDAEKTLSGRIRRVAKQNKDELANVLGRLQDRYDVELGVAERSNRSRFPLTISLSDKSVEVPLPNWGSGTQNRTQIILSILDAARIKRAAGDDKVTPFVVVEEPESFLHPTAQAEFGRILGELSDELGVQIIGTTHSPYMLNQASPNSNVLLDRHVFRKKLKETFVVDTTGDRWMIPFSECLGIVPPEFDSWRQVIFAGSTRVLLVEGQIDVEYLQHLKEKYPSIYAIPDDVVVESYGGKDALKNTQLMKFVINKFDRVFVTYDLDAEQQVKSQLLKIGMVEGDDFCGVGFDRPGSDCIEGLLPELIKKGVYSSEFDLVNQLQSGNTAVRNSAKSHLKQKLLEEFKRTECSERDLKGFGDLTKRISKAF